MTGDYINVSKNILQELGAEEEEQNEEVKSGGGGEVGHDIDIQLLE